MASLSYLQARAENAKPIVGRVRDDTPVALRITHIDSASTVTHIIVTTAASIELHDSDASTTINITAGATNTIGEVADYINGLTNWRCKILDALRDDAVNGSQLVENLGGLTGYVLNGETVYDILVDTSITDTMTYRCATERNVLNDSPLGQRPKGSHRVKLNAIVYNLNVNGASANAVRIYEWDSKNKVETQVWGYTSVDSTGTAGSDTTITFASGNGYLTAGENNDLIVRVLDATSITDDDHNFLECSYTIE